MVDDVDRSSNVAVEVVDGDKKPAASVNKIGAPMLGASLKRPPGSKKAKKGLLFRDTILSGSTVASTAVMQRIAESHNRIAAVFEKQTSQSNIKDQVSALQLEYTMHRDMGNVEAAMGYIARIQQLQRDRVAINNSTRENTTATAPVDEVDLTGEDNVEVDDSEAEQDVEEMYTTDMDAAEV